MVQISRVYSGYETKIETSISNDLGIPMVSVYLNAENAVANKSNDLHLSKHSNTDHRNSQIMN